MVHTYFPVRGQKIPNPGHVPEIKDFPEKSGTAGHLTDVIIIIFYYYTCKDEGDAVTVNCCRGTVVRL